MPNEKHSSELNENVRKNRCEMGCKKKLQKKKQCVLKTVGGKNYKAHTVAEPEQLTYIHIYLLTV